MTMTNEEAKKELSKLIFELGFEDNVDDRVCVLNMAIQALSQEPTDRIEYGTDGNAYKLWVSNGKEFEQEPCEQEPCDEYRNKRTSICGNCKEYDEFEEIDFVQEHKKIPVTLDLTPCDDTVSRILQRMWNCRGKHTTSIDKVKMEQIIREELSSVTKKTLECNDTVSRGVFEQVMRERDIAIEQLHELGYELGQKIEPLEVEAQKNREIKFLKQ